MDWLRPALFSLAALIAPNALFVACSSDDGGAPGVSDLDVSQTPIPKIEAGAPCATTNDCVTGLACLYPATTCQAYRVCAPTPVEPCPSPQAACSCLGEPIQVCGGFASDPIDSLGACGDGGVGIDAGSQGPGEGDAGDAGDATSPVDASPVDAGLDANDGATE